MRAAYPKALTSAFVNSRTESIIEIIGEETNRLLLFDLPSRVVRDVHRRYSRPDPPVQAVRCKQMALCR